MLELAAIRRPDAIGTKLQLGSVLDAMLYYGHVHLIMDIGFLQGAYLTIGFDDLRSLINHDLVTTDITPEFSGVRNDYENGVLIHNPIFGRFGGKQDKPIHSSDTIGIISGLLSRTDDTLDRRRTEKLVGDARRSDYKKILGSSNYHLESFLGLVSDRESVLLFAERILRDRGVKDARERLARHDTRAIVLADKKVTMACPPLDTIAGLPARSVGWSDVLAEISDYSLDLHLSRTLSADLIARREVGDVAAKRIDLTLQRADRSRERITAFEDFAIEGSRTFGQAFDQGHISFREALAVIDRSTKFRNWIGGLPPDADMIAEYQRELSRESVFETLPIRTARWVIPAGVGAAIEGLSGIPLLATGVVAGLSAFDIFVLSNILKGWRPNIFVDDMKQILADNG